MANPTAIEGWGKPPWVIDFHPDQQPVPRELDVAIVGGGFTGLAAAAWLRHIAPMKSVAVFETGTIGCGASGHTGGMALIESAAGDLPGLGNVLGGLSDTLLRLDVSCDLTLPGVWEIARKDPLPDSPIDWSDSGNLRAAKLLPGGTIDPGKLVSGLARTAQRLGAQIHERSPVQQMNLARGVELQVLGQSVKAGRVLLATNAMSLELSSLAEKTQPKLTLALATEPLTSEQIKSLGLESGRPFYTVDFPYLWGRLVSTGAVVFGSGLVHVDRWQDLADLDISSGQTGELIARLEHRVRQLHPCLRDVRISNRWGGPILLTEQWRPVFEHHPRSQQAIVLGGYCGHGVALSVHLGRWAAEVLAGTRELPAWNLSTSKS